MYSNFVLCSIFAVDWPFEERSAEMQAILTDTYSQKLRRIAPFHYKEIFLLTLLSSLQNVDSMLNFAHLLEIKRRKGFQFQENFIPSDPLTRAWTPLPDPGCRIRLWLQSVGVQRPFSAQIYGYIRDKRSGGELSLPSIGRPAIY